MSTTPNAAAPDVQSCIASHGGAALAELDSLSPADADASRKLSEVMRHFVTMRDELIAAQRRGASCGDELQRSNMLFSSIFGVEFPVAGVQWQRVCETREALRRLLNEAAQTPHAAPRAPIFDAAARKRFFGAVARYGALCLVAALCAAAAVRRSR